MVEGLVSGEGFAVDASLVKADAIRLIVDTAYGTAAMLNWIVETKQIEPHTPVWHKYEGTAERFGMADFAWDAEADRYTCPAGKTLKRYQRNFKMQHTNINKDNNIRYTAI